MAEGVEVVFVRLFFSSAILSSVFWFRDSNLWNGVLVFHGRNSNRDVGGNSDFGGQSRYLVLFLCGYELFDRYFGSVVCFGLGLCLSAFVRLSFAWLR